MFGLEYWIGRCGHQSFEATAVVTVLLWCRTPWVNNTRHREMILSLHPLHVSQAVLHALSSHFLPLPLVRHPTISYFLSSLAVLPVRTPYCKGLPSSLISTPASLLFQWVDAIGRAFDPSYTAPPPCSLRTFSIECIAFHDAVRIVS